MLPLLILLGLVVAPVLVLILLKVNAALVFLSLCLGAVLVQFVSNDAVNVVSGASTGAHVTNSTVKLGLLVLPAILTTIFMLKTVHGGKRVLNILPALGTGFLLALLVVPLLPPATSTQVTAQQLWVNSQPLRSALVAGSAAVCLLSLWLNRPKHHGEKEGKKHKG